MPHVAFLICRLTPFDKNPGLGLIDVSGVLRRIIGKAIVSVMRNNIISSVGSVQVLAGNEAGCDAARHARCTIFAGGNTEAVLLVDPANALNSMNGEVQLKSDSHLPKKIFLFVSMIAL